MCHTTVKIDVLPQPFIKWAGGKTQILDQLSRFLPPTNSFQTYFEPFLGGGAVFLHLEPSSAILSDSNNELINLYTVIKNNVEKLMEKLEEFKKEPLSPDLYYSRRSDYTNLLINGLEMDAVDRAALFIFLNKTCYNGLYRVNRRGGFNVPFGKYEKTPNLYLRENLIYVSRLLSNKEISCDGYESALSMATENDFVYLDPPYLPSPSRNEFTSYTSDRFLKSNHEKLAQTFADLDSRGCKVLLSNSNTPYVKKLYSRFSKRIMRAGRMINSNGANRKGFQELLIFNYDKFRN
ncbi:MAG: DNA adenine methylase [Nitrososphaerales archaeon]